MQGTTSTLQEGRLRTNAQLCASTSLNVTFGLTTRLQASAG